MAVQGAGGGDVGAWRGDDAGTLAWWYRDPAMAMQGPWRGDAGTLAWRFREPGIVMQGVWRGGAGSLAWPCQEPSVGMHIFHLSTWEAELGGWISCAFEGQPHLHRELQASQGYIERPCLEINRKNKWE